MKNNIVLFPLEARTCNIKIPFTVSNENHKVAINLPKNVQDIYRENLRMGNER